MCIACSVLKTLPLEDRHWAAFSREPKKRDQAIKMRFTVKSVTAIWSTSVHRQHFHALEHGRFINYESYKHGSIHAIFHSSSIDTTTKKKERRKTKQANNKHSFWNVLVLHPSSSNGFVNPNSIWNQFFS